MRIFKILKEILPLTFNKKIAWIKGLIHPNSCGKKIRYSLKSAQKAKIKMESKYSKKFDIYTCLRCGKYHIGRSIEDKCHNILN